VIFKAFAVVTTCIRGERGSCQTAWATFPGVRGRGLASAASGGWSLVALAWGGLQQGCGVLHSRNETPVWSELLGAGGAGPASLCEERWSNARSQGFGAKNNSKCACLSVRKLVSMCKSEHT